MNTKQAIVEDISEEDEESGDDESPELKKLKSIRQQTSQEIAGEIITQLLNLVFEAETETDQFAHIMDDTAIKERINTLHKRVFVKSRISEDLSQKKLVPKTRLSGGLDLIEAKSTLS